LSRPATLRSLCLTYSGKVIEQQAVNVRELHGFLGVDSKFAYWMKIQIERARLVGNRDFILLTQKGEQKEGARGASIVVTL